MFSKAVVYFVLAALCATLAAISAFVLISTQWVVIWAWLMAVAFAGVTFLSSCDQLAGLLEKRGWRDSLPLADLAGVLGRLIGLIVLFGGVEVIVYLTITVSLRHFCGMNWHVAAAMAVLAGLLVGYVAWQFGAHLLMGGNVSSVFLRGRRLLSLAQVKRLTAHMRSGPTVFWGGVDLSRDVIIRSNVCFVGAPGAGKTTLINRLMGSTLSEVKPGSDQRALVYDFKGNLYPILHSITSGRVVTMNAFDVRCAAWELARDIVTVASANQFAVTLIPVEPGPNRYFNDAARNILSQTLQALIRKAPGKWTLRDVLLVLQEPHYLKQLLAQFPETRSAMQYFAAETTYQNIHSTIQATLFPYAPIAAAWYRAKRRISLSEWVTQEWVLHLGAAESIRFQQDVLNRLMIQGISELTLSQSESRTRRTYLYLDETRMLGKSELHRFLTGGRSKGGIVILGFQDIDGVRDVFGDNGANELAGLCPCKALLRMDSATTAKWASELVGQAEWMDYRRSNVNEKTLLGGQTGEQRADRPVILPSEFMSFAPTTPENGLTGVFLHPAIGAHKATIPWDQLMSGIPLPSPQVPEFVKRPDEHQHLPPFTEAELTALGLTPLPVEAAAVSTDRLQLVGKPNSHRLVTTKGKP